MPTCCGAPTLSSGSLEVLQAKITNYWKDNLQQYVVPVKSNVW